MCNSITWIPSDATLPVPGTVEGVNVLGLLVFSISFGLNLGSTENGGKQLRDVFANFNKVIMNLISLVIW